MPSVLIQGGRVIDPASGLDATADVLVVNDRVERIEPRPGVLTNQHGSRAAAPDGVQVIDAEGLIVAPGLLDIHVHFREPSSGRHRETIASGAHAAAMGGFTCTCCMPNTIPPLDDPRLINDLSHKSARAVSKGHAAVYVVACATKERKGAEPADIASLAAGGAVGFSDDGEAVVDAGVLERVLTAVRQQGSVFMQHCQDPALSRGGVMNAGVLATKLGLGGWPREAEEDILERDVRLNSSIAGGGARYHAQHLSSGGSVEIIRAARLRGEPVTGEASPHHLLLTEEACAEYNTFTKMNPPLRARRDIEALKKGLAEGVITVLATDHAPHPPHTKQTDFTSASFGIVGVECALPLYAMALIDDGVLEWPRMLALMTIEPARITGLDRRGHGMLSVGGRADITIIDPALEWTINPDEFVGAERNCPFGGWNVRGRAVWTMVGGRVGCSRLEGRVKVG